MEYIAMTEGTSKLAHEESGEGEEDEEEMEEAVVDCTMCMMYYTVVASRNRT